MQTRRTNDKAVSNEEIIAALLGNGTIKAAAAAAGIAPRTIYDRMKDKGFREEYKTARADVVRQAAISLNGKIAAAIDTIAEIMQDQDTNPATRLQAAQTILTHAGKFAERLTAAEQIAEAERESLF